METLVLKNRLVYKLSSNSRLASMALILLGTLLLGLSAQVAIPLQPVPLTLQSFAIIFMGLIFGPRLAGQMICWYLVAGFCGLPIFANFLGGPQVLFSPTAGYLLGFAPAAILTGILLQRGWARYRGATFLAGLLGSLVIFIPGYFILSVFVGSRNAYLFGVAPFYLIELCKLMIFTLVAPFCWK